MGWVDEHEQQEILLKYKQRAEHVCDACKKPIFVNQLFTVDPKGGHFKKSEDAPTWYPARPKTTYHFTADCDPTLMRRRGKKAAKPKEEPVEENVMAGPLRKVARAILDLLTRSNKKQYWKKTVVVRSLKEEYKAAKIRQALREMIAQGILRKNGRILSPAKKKR